MTKHRNLQGAQDTTLWRVELATAIPSASPVNYM
jgi:hypothetical protein